MAFGTPWNSPCEGSVPFCHQIYHSIPQTTYNKELKNTSRTTSLPRWHKPPVRAWPINNVYQMTTQQTFVGLEDILKTSSRHLLKTSSTRLQRNNFTSSKTSWRLVVENEKLLRWRRIEDVLKTCFEDVLKTCVIDVLKGYLEDVLKTLWRQTTYLLGISVSKKSKCVSNKSTFHKFMSDNSKTIPKYIN